MYPVWAINRLENNRKGHQFSLPQDRQKKHFETLLIYVYTKVLLNSILQSLHWG